jgi:hypothetical protein
MAQDQTYRGYPPNVRVERGRFGYLLAPEHRAAIAAAAPPGSTISDADWIFLEEIFGGFLRMRRRRQSISFSEERTRWERIAKLMPDYEPAMRERVEAYIEYFSTTQAFGRREDPHRDMLYGGVFRVWTNLGGQLKFSRSAKGETGGPLVRFFLACVGPILDAQTPKSSSIPQIIKAEREARQRRMELFPAFVKLAGTSKKRFQKPI